jgi:hypothetical protein
MRPQARTALDAGLKPWLGENLHGKKLLLMHAHGFGDTIQMLRYVPALRAMGADVTLMMPKGLERLAIQHGPVVNDLIDADYFCPILHLLHFLKVAPTDVVGSESYLDIYPEDVARWRNRINSHKRKIGIAWSVGKPSHGDYPRVIGLDHLVEALLGDAEIYSVQAQGADEARKLGVHAYEFADFADCAAMMTLMDEIISVDTAALHLAGAIGHPCVYGLLSHWASWRWIAPWYANVRLVRQVVPDDWSTALEQI